MIKYIEMTGSSEEDAVAKALAQLGMDRDDVSVEVLGRAKKGFLGIGSVPAKVKVSYEAEDEEPVSAGPEVKPVSAPAPQPVREEPKPAVQPVAPVPPGKEVRQEKKAESPAAPAEPAASGSRAEKTEAFLVGLLAHMDMKATPKITETPEGNLDVDLVGENLGSLIGRRGETLDAIQQLTNYAVNHGQSKRVRIHIDAENYRAKREESLQRLAFKMAGKVVKYRKNVMLEPMNAYERHVIHTALQEYRHVTTYSTGSEPNRHIVVAYSRDE
ncbi:MAG: KH domain-containing protein [Oscillospiraceae bacterium]|nr:KH domain-containing protein [Oscillospiraceae bacterium]